MTEKLELVKTFDFQSDAGTVDLLSYSDGFEIAYGGWTPSIEINRDGYVEEVIKLRAKGTSQVDLANNIQKLNNMVTDNEEYLRTKTQTKGVWLRVQLPGETNARQTFVHDIQHDAASSIYDYAVRNRYHINQYNLGIERYPWWEGTTAVTISAGSVSCYGGTFAYSGVSGDLPARLAEVFVSGYDQVAGTALSMLFPWGQFWLGFRTDAYGTAADWISKFYLGGGHNFGTVVDGYALLGTAAYNNISSAGLGSSVYYGAVYLGDITANPEKFYGSFLVLVRARIEAAPGGSIDPEATYQFSLRMATGFREDLYTITGDFYGAHYYPSVIIQSDIPNPEVIMDEYHIYELGEVTLPLERFGNYDYSRFTMAFWAAYLGGGEGTAVLHLDHLFFVPTGEGFYWGGRHKADFPNIINRKENEFHGFIYPDASMDAIIDNVGSYFGTYAEEQPYFYRGLPPKDGIAVFVADTFDNELPATKNIYSANISLKYLPRHRSLMGSA